MQLSDFSLKPMSLNFRKPLPDASYEVFEYDGRLYDYLHVDQIVELASRDSKEIFKRFNSDITSGTHHWSKLYPSSVQLENGASVWVLFQIFVKEGFETEHFMAFLCLNDIGVQAVKQAQQHYTDTFHQVLEWVVDSYIEQDAGTDLEWDSDEGSLDLGEVDKN